MTTTFYIVWYASAAILLLLAILMTRHVRWWLRIIIPSFIFALGFTPIPIAGPGVGAVFPLALLFISRDWWLQSVGVATVGIGSVTAITFGILLIPTLIIRNRKRKAAIGIGNP